MSRCCLALEGLSVDAAAVAAVAAGGVCEAVANADACVTSAVASSARPPHFSSSPTKPRSRSSGTKRLCRPTIVGVRIPDRNMPVSLPSRAQSRWWGAVRIPRPRPRLCWLGGAGAAPLRSAAANGTARELRRAVLARCARPAGACAELRSRSLLLFLLLYRRWRWSGVCAFVRCCSGSLLPSQRCLRWWWLGRGAGIWQRHHLSDDEGDSDDDVVAAASASPASYFADTAGEETGSASGIAHAATLCLQGHARARSRLLAVLACYRSTHTLLDGSQAAVWGWMTARSATTTTARGSFSRLLGSRARQAFAKAQGPRVLTRGASAGGGRRR